MHIVSIVGARPNFVKIAPIAWEIRRRGGIRHTIIHTGQHYDEAMSQGFFDVLEIPRPDVDLGVGSGSHGVQTGKIMIAIEPILERLNPDWVLTVGDVNSTAAATLVAVKLGLRTVHVEAGLRSLDRKMPEEINRIVTDSISDLLLVTEQAGMDNLLAEGISREKIRFTGNVMIDTLVGILPKARQRRAWEDFALQVGEYLLVTLHRPSNVDHREQLEDLVGGLIKIGQRCPIFFPAHPRTVKRLEEFGLLEPLRAAGGVTLSEPLDYLTFLSLTVSSRAVLTDSGGIQEETTYLGIPCLTLRENTERPSTIELGTNELVQPSSGALLEKYEVLESGSWKRGSVPPLWDGHASERVLDALQEKIGKI